MNLALTEIQQITLRDVLTTAGLTARQVEDVFLLLSFKDNRTQRAFYHRACGSTYDTVGEIMGEARTVVQYLVNVSCSDINKYLRQQSLAKL